MEIEPIGFLRTCFGEKFAVPRQPGMCPAAWGLLEFLPEFRSAEAVRGLDGFSHVWIIFGFHKTEGEGWRPTVRPPRLGGNERVGVFASRSTYRPNGLGLSLLKLDRIAMVREEGLAPPALHFSGVDLVDGTPVYDVKPYIPFVESPPEPRGGFAAEPPGRIGVKVDPKAQGDFSRLPERHRRLVLEVLSLDPRPAASPDQEGKTHGALLCGKNVLFCFRGATCWITGIAEIR